MDETRRTRWIEPVLSLAGVAAIALVILLIPALRHGAGLALHGDLHGLRRQLLSLGWEGALVILALIVAHAVLFFPAELVNATAGFAYGFAGGLGLCMVAWLLSSLVAYALGRTSARPLLRRLLGRRRMGRVRGAVSAGGVPLLIVGRLLPVVPSAPMSYLAGASDVRLVRFAWTTVVGSLPLTAAVVYLGSRAQSLSLSSPVVWGVVALLVLLLGAARWVPREWRLPR